MIHELAPFVLLALAVSHTPCVARTPAVPERPARVEETVAQDQEQPDDPAAALVRALEVEGLHLDLERGWLGVPATVLVRRDLLEYILVGTNGQAHESVFLTGARPSLINAALLAIGMTPGKNARWDRTEMDAVIAEREAQGATPEEAAVREGLPRPELLLPEGPRLYLYAAWREGEESFLYRIEDLINNLRDGRTLERHGFVYLGSRFASLREGEAPVFLADVEENLVNLSFFFQGNTLMTAALPECLEQTVWAPNFWLLPPREAPVLFLFASSPLKNLPPSWEAFLPDVTPWVEADPGSDGR